MKFLELITECVLFVSFLSIVIGNILRLVMWIICFRKKECSDRNCLLHEICYKYHEIIMAEDIERMEEILRSYREALNKEYK